MLSPAEETEHRDQQEQQGEQREKPVEGQQGAERSAPIVAELLDHAESEREGTHPLLGLVHRAERPLEGVH